MRKTRDKARLFSFFRYSTSNRVIFDALFCQNYSGEISHSLVGKWPSKNKGTRDASVGRSKNVDEAGLWQTIIRTEAHSLATHPPCMR